MTNQKLSLLIILILGFASASSAQTTTGDASFTIMAPLTITNTVPLNFGGIISSSTAGQVVFNPTTGVRTPSGGITLLTGATAPASIAVFNITGAANKSYNITIPTAPITITKDGGGATMTVSSFVSNVGTIRALNSLGEDVFKIGATLNVGANQAAGIYSGTYQVKVEYQ